MTVILFIVNVNGIRPGSCQEPGCLTDIGQEISAPSKKCQMKNAPSFTLSLMWKRGTKNALGRKIETALLCVDRSLLAKHSFAESSFLSTLGQLT